MNLGALRASLIAHEGLRLGNVRPASSIHDRHDASCRHTIFGCEHFPGDDMTFIAPSDVSDFIVSQLRNISPCFSFGSRLQSNGVSVNHLFAHSCQFKVLGSIIGLAAVFVINCQSWWYGANKMFIDGTMRQYFLRCAVPVSPQVKPDVRAFHWLDRPSRSAPKSLHPSNMSGVAYFV